MKGRIAVVGFGVGLALGAVAAAQAAPELDCNRAYDECKSQAKVIQPQSGGEIEKKMEQCRKEYERCAPRAVQERVDKAAPKSDSDYDRRDRRLERKDAKLDRRDRELDKKDKALDLQDRQRDGKDRERDRRDREKDK